MDNVKQAVEEALKMSEGELKTMLPQLMEALKGNVGSLMETVPDLIPRLLGKMNEMDIAKFIKEAPDASSKFMDVLWEGVAIATAKNEEARNKLKGAGTITVNFKATDSSLEGNLKIADGKMTGGSTLLPEADITISGETKMLVGMFTGSVDPVKGFMARKYTMKGKMSLGMKLAPVMTSVAKSLGGH